MSTLPKTPNRRRSQPPLKYHGGKSYLAPWIISLFPEHYTHYHEPFFGGGAVLFRLDHEGVSEAVNDLDRHLMRFWQVVQDPHLFNQLIMRLHLTPFADWVFHESHPCHWEFEDVDPVVRAAAFILRNRLSRQGLGKDYATPTSRVRRGMNESVAAYLSAIEGLPEIHARLQRVELREMDAVEFVRRYDHEQAIFYLDPPYVHSTRTVPRAYVNEMSDQQHHELLEELATLRGKFLLSGYASEFYAEAAERHGWNLHEKQIDNKAGSGSSKRIMTECVWTNY